MSVPFVPDPDPPYEAPLTVAPGVRRLVARNPGPFTMTGTSRYLIGDRDLAVVDPGPLEAADSLMDALAPDQRVAQIWITHTHRDHSPAAAPLKDRTGAPTLGFGPHGAGKTGGIDPNTGFEAADWDFSPDTALADGVRVETAAGTWAAVHTPGHCSNHLCFFRASDRVLIAGDHLMSQATPIVSPPDGDMAAYLAGLDRLIALAPALILPAHGAPIAEPMAFLAAVKAHRLAREDKVLAALSGGPATLPELLARVYDDVPKALYPAAARSLLAHLIKLAEDRRVRADPAPTEAARYALA
ncbi:MAG: MBL fold metallo-hydrolase [Rhodothalassiaceae bacterium]